ncbi:MAG: hypothetical protein HEQ26_15860 [Dolichospermum sp. DL01]|nr:MAG: hypothetical protein HEQ26_15860 [Dolichospermum sp. DL01]
MSKLVAYHLSIQERMSWGEKLLILADATPEKKAGVSAFADKDYPTAIAKFQAALIQQQNDPETLIYLNNARFVSDNAPKIAVSVPIGSNLNVARELLRGVAQAQDKMKLIDLEVSMVRAYRLKLSTTKTIQTLPSK